MSADAPERLAVEPAALAERLERGDVFVIDLRDKVAYMVGHVPGAYLIPRGTLEVRLETLRPDRRRAVAVYCEDGASLSLPAAETLEGLGYRNVRILAGGWRAWKAAGLPRARGDKEEGKAFGEAMARAAGVREIEPGELRDLMGRDVPLYVLDVREPDEYGHAHPEGALSLPRGRLELDAPALLPDRGRAVVVTCDGGPRSVFAADRLRAMGYGNVRVMRGGLPGWRAGGLPTPPSYPEWLVGFPIKIEQVPPDPDAGRGAGGATSGST
jgi:cystathionine beta-lyase